MFDGSWSGSELFEDEAENLQGESHNKIRIEQLEKELKSSKASWTVWQMFVGMVFGGCIVGIGAAVKLRK